MNTDRTGLILFFMFQVLINFAQNQKPILYLISGQGSDYRIYKYFKFNEFDTVNGKVKYNKDGVAVFTSTASQWWNGKQMTVYPFKWSKYKIKLAPPWNKRN